MSMAKFAMPGIDLGARCAVAQFCEESLNPTAETVRVSRISPEQSRKNSTGGNAKWLQQTGESAAMLDVTLIASWSPVGRLLAT
jgi:hypothetical protein